MRNALIPLLLGFSVATAAPAADIFDGVDLRPLVRMHSTRYGFNTIPSPPLLEFSDGDSFVSVGGATINNIWLRTGDRPFNSFLRRGVGSPILLSRLRSALTTNRVGIHKNCQIDTGGVLSGFIEITWYGQGPRRNAFRASLGAGDLPDLPICSQEVERTIRAIDDYFNQVEYSADFDVSSIR
ncbi:MAG: hypothetical protein ABJC13_01065 [Acidobacteriota bacterium]